MRRLARDQILCGAALARVMNLQDHCLCQEIESGRHRIAKGVHVRMHSNTQFCLDKQDNMAQDMQGVYLCRNCSGSIGQCKFETKIWEQYAGWCKRRCNSARNATVQAGSPEMVQKTV